MENYHEELDRRSLELHKLYAEKIRENPALLEKAKATLSRWQAIADGSGSESTIQEWYDILNLPLCEVLGFITSDSERATRLRQSNPFPGLLSTEERAAFRKQWKTSRESRDIGPSLTTLLRQYYPTKEIRKKFFTHPVLIWEGQTPLEALKNGERDKVKQLLIQRLTGMVC